MTVETRVRRLEQKIAGSKRFVTYADALEMAWAKRQGKPIPPELEDLPLHPDLVAGLRRLDALWRARLANREDGGPSGKNGDPHA